MTTPSNESDAAKFAAGLREWVKSGPNLSPESEADAWREWYQAGPNRASDNNAGVSQPNEVRGTAGPEGTGRALRYNTNKPELSYVLTYPEALKTLSAVQTYGATKYARGNYLLGSNWTQYVDSLLRHLTAFYAGEDIDPESGQPHTGHVLFNAMMLAQMFETRKDLDDRLNQKTVAVPDAVVSNDLPSYPEGWVVIGDEAKWNGDLRIP